MKKLGIDIEKILPLPMSAELYRLRDDPGEMHNLADQGEFLSIEKEMVALLREWMASTADAFPTGGIPRPQGEAEIVEREYQNIQKMRG